MTATRLPEPIDRLDVRITQTLARLGVPVVRVALGIVFLWFGALKFVPGLSPAEELATRTMAVLSAGHLTPAMALPILASWESLIGLGLLFGRGLRLILLLLYVQMAGTMIRLVTSPHAPKMTMTQGLPLGASPCDSRPNEPTTLAASAMRMTSAR